MVFTRSVYTMAHQATSTNKHSTFLTMRDDGILTAPGLSTSKHWGEYITTRGTTKSIVAQVPQLQHQHFESRTGYPIG